MRRPGDMRSIAPYIAVTWAGEAARPLLPSKHFPLTAGAVGVIHGNRMKHDRRVSFAPALRRFARDLSRAERRGRTARDGDLGAVPG